jgi:peroxiredoxin
VKVLILTLDTRGDVQPFVALHQREAATRLQLPFPLLSDSELTLTRALELPTFTAAGQVLLTRLTLVVRDGVVEHIFYPVFPPDTHASLVLEWLRGAPSLRPSRGHSLWVTSHP